MKHARATRSAGPNSVVIEAPGSGTTRGTEVAVILSLPILFVYAKLINMAVVPRGFRGRPGGDRPQPPPPDGGGRVDPERPSGVEAGGRCVVAGAVGRRVSGSDGCVLVLAQCDVSVAR